MANSRPRHTRGLLAGPLVRGRQEHWRGQIVGPPNATNVERRAAWSRTSNPIRPNVTHNLVRRPGACPGGHRRAGTPLPPSSPPAPPPRNRQPRRIRPHRQGPRLPRAGPTSETTTLIAWSRSSLRSVPPDPRACAVNPEGSRRRVARYVLRPVAAVRRIRDPPPHCPGAVHRVKRIAGRIELPVRSPACERSPQETGTLQTVDHRG